MEQALQNIDIWSRNNQMKISSEKTYILHIGKNNPRDQYKLDNITIKEVESIRDLGIIIDNKLKFTEHYSKIIRNTYFRMRTIFKVVKSRSIKTWILVYKSYIRPLLEYALETWNPQLKKDICAIEKCQKYFTKILLKKCRLPHLPYEQRLRFLELPTLEERRNALDLVMAFKIINKYTHLDPRTIFNFSNREQTRLNRIVPKFRLYKRLNSFTSRITNKWNLLDKTLTNAQSPAAFKANLYKIIQNGNNRNYPK